MELTENTVAHLDSTLCAYPFDLPEYFHKIIQKSFQRRGVNNTKESMFEKTITHMNENNLFLSKNHKIVSDYQFDFDLFTHEHTNWLGLKKRYYLPAAFTYAYKTILKFSEEYPEYILVAIIKVQIEKVPAPKPWNFTTPFTRVSFYFYNQCSDGPMGLYDAKNMEPHDKKIMFWRFSTFDIPLLDWMIKKAKYEDRERKKEKARERARAKKASELAHAQRMAYVNNIEK